jgi:mitogen-activated protein kinase kinase kinase
MRKAIKFVAEDGVSKMIAVSDCIDGREVLERVLRKFHQKGTGNGAAAGVASPELSSGMTLDESLDEWGVFSIGADGQRESLGASLR